MMRLAAWIAVCGVAVALFGWQVVDDWRVTAVGGGLGAIAVCAWLIDIRDAWDDD